MTNEHYEVVHHYIKDEIIMEVYSRSEHSNNLEYIKDYSNIPFGIVSKELHELRHSDNYKKVKSPFKDDNGDDIYLYGRYINISNRIKDEINRF
jgi:hypothetical protein